MLNYLHSVIILCIFHKNSLMEFVIVIITLKNINISDMYGDGL